MSVAQRKDGRWICKYKEGNTWKQRSFRDEEEARTFNQQKQDEILAEIDDRMTGGELALAYYRSNTKHPKTVKNVVHFLCGHEKDGIHVQGAGEFLRDLYAEDLTRKNLEQMRDRGTSNNTINHMQAYLRAILAWGVDQELIRINPWRDYQRLPVQRVVVSVSLATLKAVYEASPPSTVGDQNSILPLS